ncbi:hypothetical protein OIU84_026425 [Salix udensis]|uniref:Uncharacterized protein n=1 Tax=Salix udensis TaxID=889485 RepID=A0AAD6KLV8_9ROSI|nr:hypothetical protein OIU84_026425 [Salix udensis]
MIFTSTGAACTSTAPATTGSFPFLLEFPFTMLSKDDAASWACCWFRMMSLWHLEHMFMVAALPKKPQLLMQRIGPSGAWHPVSS